MAITYSYAFNQIRVVSQGELEDVVKEIDVNVWGMDGDIEFYSSATVQLGEADPADFTPFSSLTLEQATAWVDANPATTHAKNHVANVIARKIEQAAMEVKPLPWSQ